VKKGCAWLAFLFALTTFNSSASVSESGSESQIRTLIESFRTSIINNDKSAFSDDIPFIAVFSEEMLQVKRRDNPDYSAAVDFGKFGPPVSMLADNVSQEESVWEGIRG